VHGRKLAVHVHYYGWKSDFPDAVMQDDDANGRLPMVSWESGGTMKATIAGEDDDMLVARAKAVKAYGKPMFIRYMWEMNLMLPGHLKVYGNSREDAASLYVATWRHIWKIFHDQGVTNVVWVWNPSSAAKIAEGPRVDAAPFYPGDEFVDWIGMDAYDRTDPPVGFVRVFDFFYKEFQSHKKPYMIVETGAFPMQQTTYLHQVQTMSKTAFPLLKGFLYFDAPGHTTRPWSLTPEGIKAFAELGKDPYFQGHP
jgi:beta-mannanase